MWWLRMIVFSVLVLVAAVAVTAAETEVKTPPAMPVAVVENGSQYNFPAVLEGEDIKHDFVIRNTGDAPLIIEDVKAG